MVCLQPKPWGIHSLGLLEDPMETTGAVTELVNVSDFLPLPFQHVSASEVRQGLDYRKKGPQNQPKPEGLGHSGLAQALHVY